MTRAVPTLVLVLTIAICAVSTAEGQHPNINRGFEADKVYQFGGVDSVNLYNGNLALSVPIGGAYGGNGTLKYALSLNYNSKNWDYEYHTFNSECPSQFHNYCYKEYKKAIPTRRSNAGMGWTLSLGRLFTGGDPTPDPYGHWMGMLYESPDGADHLFTVPDQSNPNVFYTADGSFLRLVMLGGWPAQYQVHFPDGMIHMFSQLDEPYAAPWQILDPFGNRLEITYTAAQWTLREYAAGSASALRTHFVHIKDTTVYGGTGEDLRPQFAPANYNFVVEKVDLAGFNGERADYLFEYTGDQIAYGCFGDGRNMGTNANETPDPKVPRLRRVILPDGSDWKMDYYSTVSGSGSMCAAISKLVLPTEGFLEWTYDSYVRPTQGCADVGQESWIAAPYAMSEGVATKRATEPFAGTTGLWTYTQESDQQSGGYFNCWGVSSVPKSRWAKVTVVRPDAGKSEHFFSLVPWSLSLEGEFALPYTRSEGLVPGSPCSGTSDLCLSSREYDCSTGSCVKTRSRYVRYEGEARVNFFDPYQPPQYRREVESRTVFHDDGDRYVETKRSEYDGLGHYRRVTSLGSWSALQKSEVTNYNPSKPMVSINPVTWANTPANNRPPASSQWLLSLFDSKSLTDGTQTLKTELWFDETTGALKRQRTLKSLDGSRGTNDLIVKYDRDGLGNVSLESFYGGDQQTVGTGTLSSLTLPATAEYRIARQYQFGTPSYSAYLKSNGDEELRIFQATIDQSTGLVKSSSDTAGVATEYTFDDSGRLTTVMPGGRASEHYQYAPAAPSTKARVTATRKSTLGAVLTTSKYEYDGLGRIARELVTNPNGTESRRETAYDVAGRKEAVTELGTDPSLPFTAFEYDGLGRVEVVRTPDLSETIFGYSGSREKTHTSFISLSSSANDTPVTRTENYDPFGRLTKVTEKAGPITTPGLPGGDVITEYTYDVGDRLIGVRMGVGSTAVQNRIFDYDGRGFLRWESHPEAGMTSYTYDSRGRVLTKTQSAAASQFDLQYTYDRAERLLELKGRNPFFGLNADPEFRPLKVFQYATSNASADLRKGKLEFANRYNYPPWPDSGDTYLIRDVYTYQDDAGRLTGKETAIFRLDAYSTELKRVEMGMTYDDLGQPKTISYPWCLNCGGPPVDPLRTGMLRTYSQGRLESIAGWVDLNYWPNGMRHQIVHANGIVDTQTVGNMARPAAISFGPYTRCEAPRFVSQPGGGQVPTPGSSFPLTVSVSGTGPFEFEWWNETDSVDEGTTQSVTVQPAHDTTYYVTVTNACGFERSQSARVTIASCETPSTGALTAVLQPDRSFVLTPDPVARQPRTFKWKRLSDGVEWTTETLAVPAPTATITYTFKVTDTCGASAESSITLKPPLAITSTALLATAFYNPTRVVVTWPAVSGATTYFVERRSGEGWQPVGQSSTATFTDQSVVAAKTYAYRVYATGGGSQSEYSNSDVATTRTFTQAVPNMPVTASVTNQMLEAVNSVRAAVGWPPVTWSNILAATDPVPNPGNMVMARHVTSTRARMNEALQALGVPAQPYQGADVIGQAITAAHMNEVHGRAQ